jgi:hypothetical protein
MNKADEEFQLKINPRPTETVSINIPVDVLESLKQIALYRSMSLDALIKFYVGQGLRQDLANHYSEQILSKTTPVLPKHINSSEENGMVDNFVKSVRNSAEKHRKESAVTLPNQKGFNPKDWSNYFKASKSRTRADHNLYSAGLWFHQNAISVREKTNQIFSAISVLETQESLLRLQVGMVNFRVNEIKNRYDPSKINQLLSTKSFEMTDIIEKFITSARYPISGVINNSKKPISTTSGFGENSDDLLNFLDSTINLGIDYDFLENFWNECLWNEFYINNSGTDDLLMPSNLERNEIYEINLLRWVTICQISSIEGWLSSPDEVRRKILSWPRLTTKISLNNHQCLNLELRDPLISSQEKFPSLPDLALSSFLRQDFYPESILDEPLPKALNLTLRQLLSAWRFIASMAEDITEEFPQTKLHKKNDLLCFSPIFSRKSLISLMEKVIPSINSEQASKILQLMMFRNNRDDLWTRPLIEVDEDNLTAIFTALESPNLSRVVSEWMHEGGLKISDKGHEFERIVYEKLCEANKLSNATIFPTFYFKTSQKEEEIDLVIKLGKTIILCELKCILFPVNPYQLHRYYQELESASEQITRKSSFISENLKDFLNQIHFDDCDIEEIKIFSIIISNLPLATGYSFQGVPVVDLKILQDYLDGGKFTFLSQSTETGSFEPIEQIQVYSTEEEAEANVQKCLNDPPHIRRLQENIRRTAVPVFLDLNADEDPIALWLRIEIELPQAK